MPAATGSGSTRDTLMPSATRMTRKRAVALIGSAGLETRSPIPSSRQMRESDCSLASRAGWTCTLKLYGSVKVERCVAGVKVERADAGSRCHQLSSAVIHQLVDQQRYSRELLVAHIGVENGEPVRAARARCLIPVDRGDGRAGRRNRSGDRNRRQDDRLESAVAGSISAAAARTTPRLWTRTIRRAAPRGAQPVGRRTSSSGRWRARARA
jgi:hypothetical protein